MRVPDLERVPDFKRSFQAFPFRSFTNRSNILKNAFYAFIVCWNDWIVLDRSICSREKTIVPQERRPALSRPTH